MFILLSCVGLFFIALFEYERWIRKESLLTWYRSPLCAIGAYNTFLRMISTNQPFLPLRYFPGHEHLEKHHAQIREEVLTFIRTQNKTREFGEVETYSKHISSPEWQCFFIKCYGKKTTELAGRYLPLTSSLIQEKKQIRLAMLSVLKPHAKIPAHWGPSKACYRYHLTLSCDASEKAFINVDGTPYHWKEGEGVLFDDTYSHFVENDTDSLRIVLFCDVDRQLKFPFNVFNTLLLNLVGRHQHLRGIEQQFML
ncbi:MAG: aspartyl/asparaginyl beta-hydroxylase domain-containing protein [Gammaproteobacteria bacterium]|nr:aspartyl/asparaginyl beta-hydroxylase domain-containing protein [Gammaproteobacteria bacterium]